MSKMQLKNTELFDLAHTRCEKQLRSVIFPWKALAHIGEWISEIGKGLDCESYVQIAPDIWVARSAKVAPSAALFGPCIIGEGAEVRHCAFIRGNAIVGDGAVVGNSTELKNVILFDGVQVPHYNYVGDSILGYRAHLGAGAITSNVKGDKSAVVIKYGDTCIEAGRKKVVAFLGDHAEIGCGCVLNPGTVVGKDTQVYPLCAVRGVLPANAIYKDKTTVVKKK